MANTSLAVTAGSGTNLAGWSRSVDATTVMEQLVIPGEDPRATYSAIGDGIAIATSADHVLMAQADGTNYLRLRKVFVHQAALAGAVGTASFSLFRTTTAGTGGSAVSALPFDGADTNPYGGSCMTLPTAKGTEGNRLWKFRLGLTATNPVTFVNSILIDFDQMAKPIVVGTGTGNGIVLKVITGIATVTVDVCFLFSITSYI